MSWHQEFFAALDNRDEQAVRRWLADEVTLRVANRQMVEGRDTVLEGLRQFWDSIAAMSHEVTNLIEAGDEAFVESLVTYTRLDGRTVTVPAATWIERRDGKVAAQRVYIDLQPLFDD